MAIGIGKPVGGRLCRFSVRLLLDPRLRVGTSITEGTANFLVNRRMNKSQQMRWSRRGADLLLQVRCAVLNGKLGSGFEPLFDAEVNPIADLARAA